MAKKDKACYIVLTNFHRTAMFGEDPNVKPDGVHGTALAVFTKLDEAKHFAKEWVVEGYGELEYCKWVEYNPSVVSRWWEMENDQFAICVTDCHFEPDWYERKR